MTLVGFWFIAIAVLWTGFFVLEGFDFGVGILHSPIGRTETGRAMTVATIGPLWDGNEVWLVVAAAAMFAAFPGWYATTFSGFYLAVVLLLAALIVRGVAFEYREKVHTPRWRHTWDLLLTTGSLLAPLLIGITLGNLLHGVPIGANQQYEGNFWDLIRPYPVFVGVTLVVLCCLHGATFIALKTTGPVRDRATHLARLLAPPAALVVLVYAFWTHITAGHGVLPNVIEVAAVLAVIAGAFLIADRREGWAFTTTTFAMATTVLSLFVDLYPNLLVSTKGDQYNLTIHNTAAGSYSLKVMTVVVALLLPVVIAYQAWTYHVFRHRLTAAPQQAPTGAGAAAGATARRR
jgi:cytochrome bd ubiquinol oxidase subunit II